MKKLILLLAISMIFTSCSMVKPNAQHEVKIKGIIQKKEMSTYQYGTHILKTADKTYALISNSLDLDTYLNKPLSISGVKVIGYPVENGPDLIDVTHVRYKK